MLAKKMTLLLMPRIFLKSHLGNKLVFSTPIFFYLPQIMIVHLKETVSAEEATRLAELMSGLQFHDGEKSSL